MGNEAQTTDDRRITHVCFRRRDADEAAAHMRESGYKARVYPRIVRAEGTFAEIFVVVSNSNFVRR